MKTRVYFDVEHGDDVDVDDVLRIIDTFINIGLCDVHDAASDPALDAEIIEEAKRAASLEIGPASTAAPKGWAVIEGDSHD